MKDYIFRGKPVERFEYLLTRNYSGWENNIIDGFFVGSLIKVKEDGQDRCYIARYGAASHKEIHANGYTTMVEVIPETVGQYVFMKDPNGKMVFEGDIIEGTERMSSSWYGMGQSGHTTWTNKIHHIVEMTPSNLMLTEMYFRNKSKYDVEVVGNIYDEVRENGE